MYLADLPYFVLVRTKDGDGDGDGGGTSSGVSPGAIAGIFFAVVLLLVIVFIVVYCRYQNKKSMLFLITLELLYSNCQSPCYFYRIGQARIT